MKLNETIQSHENKKSEEDESSKALNHPEMLKRRPVVELLLAVCLV
ncbi:hypothetical protein T03_3213 [Trichinella britovi]|uniref:Uncharacterized protein n=1 Tax=Trichinella britovi TaxID=45882 RepID=A0A0V0Z052_TRIBR|nr:hypothetical protein T03_3213 [Trichinella britovi]